jgi:hypothetical protein
VAVIVEVAESFAVVSVAVPVVARLPAATPTMGAVPSSVPPAENETVPVGALPKLAVLTIAITVKFVFAATVAGKLVIVENVGAGVIVNGTPAELLAK